MDSMKIWRRYIQRQTQERSRRATLANTNFFMTYPTQWSKCYATYSDLYSRMRSNSSGWANEIVQGTLGWAGETPDMWATLRESLRRINELEKHVSIYEHAEKFSKSTPDILRENAIPQQWSDRHNLWIFIVLQNRLHPINHKIKMEKNTNEYIRWAVSSIDVMNSLIRWCKKTSEHKDKITGKIEQNKKLLKTTSKISNVG